MNAEFKYDPRIIEPEPTLTDPAVGFMAQAHEMPTMIEEDAKYDPEFEQVSEYNNHHNNKVDEDVSGKNMSPFMQKDDKSRHLFRDLKDFKHEYPDSTNTCCWHCVHPFICRPVGIPVRRDDPAKSYIGFGCFCSASCALAYAQARKMETTLLRQMYVEVEKVTPLMASPPQSMLKLFGGPMSIEEFRSSAQKGTKWRSYHWPLMPYTILREEMLNDSKLLPMRRILPRNLVNTRQTKLRNIMSRTAS